jgi:hypothetical protein
MPTIMKPDSEKEQDKTKESTDKKGVESSSESGKTQEGNDQVKTLTERLKAIEAELEKEKNLKLDAIKSRDKIKSKLKSFDEEDTKPADKKGNDEIPDYVKNLQDLIYRQDKTTNEEQFTEIYKALPDSFKKMVDDSTNEKMLFGEKLQVAKRIAKAIQDSGLNPQQQEQQKETYGMPSTPSSPVKTSSKIVLDEFGKKIKEQFPDLSDEQAKKRAEAVKKKLEEINKK